MRHFITTSTYFGGSQIVLASKNYLEHLLPSRAELVCGGVGGFCAGIATVWVPLGWLFGRGLWLSVGVGALAGAIWFMNKHRRLRRARLNFLRSSEAKPVYVSPVYD